MRYHTSEGKFNTVKTIIQNDNSEIDYKITSETEKLCKEIFTFALFDETATIFVVVCSGGTERSIMRISGAKAARQQP